MSPITILTWNSNGESAQKAECLRRVLHNLEQTQGFHPDVVLIQEANSQPGGEIARFLEESRAFQSPVQHTPEGGSQARSYLMAVAPRVHVRQPLQSHSLLDDPWVREWVAGSFPSPAQQRTVGQELAGFRHFAVAELRVDGIDVRLANWHAPRGPSAIGSVPSQLPGGANPDAFLALAVSQLNHWLQDVPQGTFGVLAGDLNVQQAHIHQPVLLASGEHFEVLQGWEGVGRGLDYVALSLPPGGARYRGFDYHDCTGPGGSDHFIVGATLA